MMQTSNSDQVAKPEEVIGKTLLNCAFEVHRTLGGPGLLESVYEEALAWELTEKGMLVQRQLECPIFYKGKTLSNPLRLDMKIENHVIVECKATTKYCEVFESQLLTYLRLAGLKLGYVLNFGESLLKDGIHRVVNGL